MTHRVETIMDTFKTQITGLTTTGSNVFRDRGYNIDDEETEAINMLQGACYKLDEYSDSVSDWRLSVEVVAIAKEITTSGTTVAASTRANLINEEIVAAMTLLTYPHLGLSYVIKVEEGDAQPVIIETQLVPIVGIQTTWTVDFRRSVSDAGA
jgi:hypothetical protein